MTHYTYRFRLKLTYDRSSLKKVRSSQPMLV